jgi:hypothetical protein
MRAMSVPHGGVRGRPGRVSPRVSFDVRFSTGYYANSGSSKPYFYYLGQVYYCSLYTKIIIELHIS